MKKEKRIKHAFNNEEVCKLIFNSGKHYDWVITTAYYAAMHFVSYKIFPIRDQTSSGQPFELKTLDQYHAFHRLTTSKHKALGNLVFQNYPAISPDFDWLLDICMKARYQDYQQSQPNADRALKLLETIKTYLNILPPS